MPAHEKGVSTMMSIYDKILLRKRAVIETVNDELKNICQIDHTKHRSVNNFAANQPVVLKSGAKLRRNHELYVRKPNLFLFFLKKLLFFIHEPHPQVITLQWIGIVLSSLRIFPLLHP